MTDARLATLLEIGALALTGVTESQWWAALAEVVTGPVFRAEVMAVNVINPSEAYGWFRVVHPVSARDRMPLGSPMDVVLTRDHPFSVRLRDTPLVDPIKVTDLVSERQWRSLSAWERMRELTGATYHLIVNIPRPAPYIESVSVVREGRDFNPVEMALAGHLQTIVQLSMAHFRLTQQRSERLGQSATDVAAAARAVGLSAREHSVLDLLGDGVSTAGIADGLGIATRTVYRHEQNLYRKLGVGDARAAIERGRRLGLLSTTPALEAQVSSRPATRFTAREHAVLDLLVTGMTNSAIAESLQISSRTVDTHVTALLRKLNARTRTEAVATALRASLVR